MQLMIESLQETEKMATECVCTGQVTLGEMACWDGVCCKMCCELLNPFVDYDSFHVIAELL